MRGRPSGQVAEAATLADAAAACRIDVWLWRARFCKTRAQAAGLVEAGRIRLLRHGVQTRLDKTSRPVRPGDPNFRRVELGFWRDYKGLRGLPDGTFRRPSDSW